MIQFLENVCVPGMCAVHACKLAKVNRQISLNNLKNIALLE